MREKNNQLKEELATKDGFIDNLKSQLGEKENAIATLQTQLVNYETQLQQALEPVLPPVVVLPELDTTEGMQNEISLGMRQRLIEFVSERKSQAKDTRNWFQANKMITELEKILSIE